MAARYTEASMCTYSDALRDSFFDANTALHEAEKPSKTSVNAVPELRGS